MVEVNWVQMRLGGTPIERWHAHLVAPFVSHEFAWLIRRDGWLRLEVTLTDLKIQEVARYRHLAHAQRHVQRWIQSRWERTVPVDAEDPRGRKGRRSEQAFALRKTLALRELRRR